MTQPALNRELGGHPSPPRANTQHRMHNHRPSVRSVGHQQTQGSMTPQEVAECQAGGLKYDNTDSDVDGSQQRGRDGKGEARIDASNY